MQTFINPDNGDIWQFDDNVVDIFESPKVPKNLIPYVIPPVDQNQVAWDNRIIQASREIVKTDITIIRCVENDVTVPEIWRQYRRDLRAIIRSTTGDASLPFPTKPVYPAGT